MGWESVFYVQGAMTLVWCVLWFILVTDSPRQHTTISAAEKEYILSSIGEHKRMKVRRLCRVGAVFINIIIDIPGFLFPFSFPFCQ